MTFSVPSPSSRPLLVFAGWRNEGNRIEFPLRGKTEPLRESLRGRGFSEGFQRFLEGFKGFQRFSEVSQRFFRGFQRSSQRPSQRPSQRQISLSEALLPLIVLPLELSPNEDFHRGDSKAAFRFWRAQRLTFWHPAAKRVRQKEFGKNRETNR